MNDPSPKEIVSIVSASLSLAVFIILLLFSKLTEAQLPWYVLLGAPVANFAVSFYLLSFFIEKFIYRKVKLIYKTIHSLKAPKGTAPINVDMSKDMLSKVEDEVVEWTRNKTREIEELKSSDNYRKEFIGNVSHELKTPIFNVQGYLHTLIDGGLYDEKINKSYLYKASQNLDRLSTIVEDLETISQLETNAMVLDITKFDITKLVKEVYESLEMQADLRDITLEFKPDSDAVHMVLADRERIRQVLTNLLSNSLKYGKDGGTTQVGFYDMHDNLLVEVTDDGIGMDKDHLPRLFERFYRVDKSRSRDQGGTGLGLSIVKHIIEAHHQTINVRSTVGIGSTFGFTLRRAK